MYAVKYSKVFKKDFSKILKAGIDISPLNKVVKMLQSGTKLPPEYKDHKLKGKYSDCRECHVKPDWLLIYNIDKNELILHLLRTGSHSKLF